jgi:hypothetical protein
VSSEPGEIKVLFIGGYGRSGSTMLDRVLGGVEGFFSAGELRHVFREGYVENRLCGCGVPFRECGFWREVTDQAFGGMDAFDVGELIRVKDRVDRYWRVPQLIGAPSGARKRLDLDWYRSRLRALYMAIASVSGARVIVDSTKDVSHGYVLNGIDPPVEPYVCHLIRDSRAVAHSWARPKFNPGSGHDMNRYSAVRTSAEWVTINALTRLQRHFNPHYRLVRYEDLARSPDRVLHEILDQIGESERSLPLIDGRRVHGGPQHTVAGNPNRFRRGEIEIRPDESWRVGMGGRSRALVTALTLPTLLSYGFVGRERSAQA